MNQCIKTTCAYCGVGCGIQADIEDTETHQIKIQGDVFHPANHGRLCSKGSALGETVGFEDRLLAPHINGLQSTWGYALNDVASRIKSTIRKYGPESVALYGSGQLLTEDYYVANKLMKGFIGSSNIDTNSRLCMASTVAGHKRAFGEDIVPGCYEDLELADLIVLVGSNTAWCHPILFQRIQASIEKHPNKKVIVIDPRKTATCEIADLHLPLKPGTDTTLFAGLLVWLADHGAVDNQWVSSNTEGFEQALAAARKSASNLNAVSETCGLSITDLKTFYTLFAGTENVVTAWSQGTNQGFDGTDRVNAIINTHLATGRISKPGCGPLSLTGQPNAMGGREVGGLANQLAAHMDFAPEDIDRVQRFWGAPNMVSKPGLTAVDLFEAMGRGGIRLVWILGSNPAVSMPNADKVRAALERCEHVVVSDCVRNTDTGAYADILLPAAPWSEKDGTVTNSERRISRQRALFPLAGEARPDWWVLAQVGLRLGYTADFEYTCPADIFREHARLSGFENSVSESFRLFNLSGLQNLSNNDYDNLKPLQWPVSTAENTGDTERLFANGGFCTPSGKAWFVMPAAERAAFPDKNYPFILNTGRIRDQWHTMTRTARAVQLNRHIYEPFIQIHPDDAKALKVKAGELAQLQSSYGRAVARVQVDEDMTAGQVFMPMHWTREYTRGGLLGPLVHQVTDPVSRQPDSKATPVRISPWQGEWYGVLVSRRKMTLPDIEYCAAVRDKHCWRYELGGSDQGDIAHKLLPEGDVITFQSRTGVLRQAIMEEGQIMSVLCLSSSPLELDRQWLHQQFEKDEVNWRVLAGVAGSGKRSGPTVCACFGVGENTICEGIDSGLDSVEAIGRELKAGTNCGSCVPELKRYLLECKNKLELAV
ncbi:molybdopterin-dependent oxidoreductase [Sansalvadorimonas verongulae]|uniref:molybdopterin-dependent oxidoreductase n=1 Tax=Sansalvadorimonas verongulae TaxID=2172824 RepID=UPI002E32A6FF|nr:molybdopterin-dependent oxidoreductase [Sansalvadorimonas verongulae]MTI13510.1 nitrate reductase [Sansalvadorimonas verongulae]